MSKGEGKALPKPKTAGSRQAYLRELDISPRLFWRETREQQFAQKIMDQNADYLPRTIPENEVTVLAFNEIAVKHGRGYFYHLPSRAAWATPSDENRLPAQRVAAPPSFAYPTIQYMDFIWTEPDRKDFLADSHRARYLRSSALIDPPPRSTPLYAIQYVVQKSAFYSPINDSLILFGAKSGYYLCRSFDALRIIGPDAKEPHKLAPVNWLFDRTTIDKGKGKESDERRQKDRQMSSFRISDLEDVYLAIVKQCRADQAGIASTFTAGELNDLIPRPPDLHLASTIGVPLGNGASADPPSRRGEIRKSKKGPAEVDSDDPEIGYDSLLGDEDAHEED